MYIHQCFVQTGFQEKGTSSAKLGKQKHAWVVLSRSLPSALTILQGNALHQVHIFNFRNVSVLAKHLLELHFNLNYFFSLPDSFCVSYLGRIVFIEIQEVKLFLPELSHVSEYDKHDVGVDR